MMKDSGKIAPERARHSNAGRADGSYVNGLNGISRPVSRGSARTARLRPRIASMLLVGIAAAIIIVSAMAIALSSGKEASGQQGKALDTPLPPYLIIGHTYDGMGSFVPNCNVVITNVRTGGFNVTTSESTEGYFVLDINNQLPGGWVAGDPLNVTADNGVVMGWNESVLTGAGAYQIIDVTLSEPYVIPEFTTLIVPVVGIMALAAIVGLRRRKG